MMENAQQPDLPVPESTESDNEEDAEEGEEGEAAPKKRQSKPKVTMRDFHPDIKPVVARAKIDFCAMMAADNMYPCGVDLELMIEGVWERANKHYYPEEEPFELTKNVKTAVRHFLCLDFC